MKLYDAPGAPNPRRVRIFLAEKGLTAERRMLDMTKGEHKAPAFTAHNPFGQIPVLELDDGTFLSESVAICRYLEELSPEPPLMGEGALGKAAVEMWNRRVEFQLQAAISQIWLHTHERTAPLMRARGVEPAKEWGDYNRRRAAEVLEIFDREIAGRPFIAGDALTVADISALCVLDFAGQMLDLEIPETLSNMRAWHARVSARPSAKA